MTRTQLDTMRRRMIKETQQYFDRVLPKLPDLLRRAPSNAASDRCRPLPPREKPRNEF